MNRIIIGIDNGVSGAMVVLSDHPGPPIAMTAIPIKKARKGNEIDVLAAYNWIGSWSYDPARITVIIEEPGGSKSAKAATSMAGSFHALRAICEIKGIRYHRVSPREWQKVMLPGCQTGETKPRALSRARQLWPGESWLATPRCKKPNDGLIDAALIAEYGRIKNL